MRTAFGIYLGIVDNNNEADMGDGKTLGRIKVYVPYFGTKWIKWALPMSPFVGSNEGFYFIPKVKSFVWVMFQEGNTGKPVWLGGCWAEPQRISELSDTVGSEVPQDSIGTKGVFKKQLIRTKKFLLEFNDSGNKLNITALDGGDIILNNGTKGVVRKGDKTKGHTHQMTTSLTAPNGPVIGTVTASTVQDEADECSNTVKAGS